MEHDIGFADLAGMYVGEQMSLLDIRAKAGIPLSTARFRLHKMAMLRTRADAIRIASIDGKLSGRAGVTRPAFGEEWKKKLSVAATQRGDATARGLSIKPNGYVEFTRGPNKGRMQHVVVMEEIIGRSLLPHECVHHKDENRSNNDPSNLELMTRSEHARHHAKQSVTQRKRNEYGQFE